MLYIRLCQPEGGPGDLTRPMHSTTSLPAWSCSPAQLPRQHFRSICHFASSWNTAKARAQLSGNCLHLRLNLIFVVLRLLMPLYLLCPLIFSLQNPLVYPLLSCLFFLLPFSFFQYVSPLCFNQLLRLANTFGFFTPDLASYLPGTLSLLSTKKSNKFPWWYIISFLSFALI